MRRFLVIVTSLGILGCGGASDALKEKLEAAIQSEAPKKSAAETRRTEHAPPPSESGGIVPLDYPKEVPVYPNATVISSFSEPSENGKGYDVTLVMASENSVGTVAGYFTANLKGWTKIMEANEADSFTAAYEYHNGRILAVNATRSGDTTTITSNVSWPP